MVVGSKGGNSGRKVEACRVNAGRVSDGGDFME